MSNSQRFGKKYARISLKRRNQLIQLVENKGRSVAQAAKRLNIKLSTAKHIVKIFKEKGYLYHKKMRNNQVSDEINTKQDLSQKQRQQSVIVKKQQEQQKIVQIKVQDQGQCQYEFYDTFPQIEMMHYNLPCIPYFFNMCKYQN